MKKNIGMNATIGRLIKDETERQINGIELIASENYPSKSTRDCVGSIFMAKYAEGYPAESIQDSGKNGRYYGGCEVVDKIENMCRAEALRMFQLDKKDNEYHVNVQPHSGSSANEAVLMSALKLGDKILSFDLSHGGHLSHGMKLNSSGRNYEIKHYGVSKETLEIDYDEVLEIAKEYQPKMIIAGASAYPREIDFKKFRKIADEVGAVLFVDMAHIAGLVSANLHNSPFEANADYVTTTTHKTLRGNRGGLIFCKKEFARKVDTAVFPGVQGGPLINEIAGKAQAFVEANTESFKEYQSQVIKNAQHLAKQLKEYFSRYEETKHIEILTGGTDNHLILLDFSDTDFTGVQVQDMLGEYHITVNKNLLPFDERSPMVTSGVRIGTPAITTRGANEEDIDMIAKIICSILIGDREDRIKNSIKALVEKLKEKGDKGIDGRNLFEI